MQLVKEAFFSEQCYILKLENGVLKYFGDEILFPIFSEDA